MTITDQVCSRKLAETLKVLGVAQDSIFWWWVNQEVNGVKQWDVRLNAPLSHPERCSAFTVAELGEMYPQEYIVIKKGDHFQGREIGKTIPICDGDTEANARAAMIVYLLQKKLI